MTNTVLVGSMLLTLDITFIISTLYSLQKKNEGAAFFCGILVVATMYTTFIFMACLNI